MKSHLLQHQITTSSLVMMLLSFLLTSVHVAGAALPPFSVWLTYSSSSFTEAGANNGSINNSSPITITLSGDTFDQSNGTEYVANNLVVVSNLPAGLTAVITQTSTTTLSVTITGTASNHAAANNVSNITFTFQSGAFTNAPSPSSVENYAKNDLQMSFQNPYSAHAISFDGVDDYVNIPLATSPTAYTVEMWVKPASTSDAVIFERTNDGGPETAFSHELDIKDGKFQHYLFDGNSWSILGTTSVVANTWYHVAITAANDGMMRLFVNGVEEGTAVSIGTLWTDGNRYVLNGYRTSAGVIQYSGLVDELRIWNLQRSQVQISGSMNSQLAGNESGLLAYWNCDEGTGTTLYDQTNNTYNASLVNGTAFVTDVTPLPVELVSFKAAKRLNGVELQWKTATELNNHGFDLERKLVSGFKVQGSGNTTSNMNPETPNASWTRIAFVEGNGSSNEQNEYSYTDRSISAGTFAYRLKQIDRDGKFIYSPEIEVSIGGVPAVFSLQQNYPNPFNPSTTIGFTLQHSGLTTLKIYDAIGREVRTLANENLEAGVYHERTFDASRLASGIYLARLSSGSQTQIKKLMLMK